MGEKAGNNSHKQEINSHFTKQDNNAFTHARAYNDRKPHPSNIQQLFFEIELNSGRIFTEPRSSEVNIHSVGSE